ncbi:MAG: AzlD domain-containing protein [Lachnospiraceae bacterium]|nr:AzlD domain-containing protein [Lachnospiraceae bacterium]
MNTHVWSYIFVMAAVSYLIRVLPITLIRRQIKNRFIRSVLYYLPYVTLSVMTVPAIFSIHENPVCGAAGLVAGLITAWTTRNLFLTALGACLAVLAAALIV